MASMNRYLREIERTVERHTSDYAIGFTNGGHVRVTVRRGDRSRFVITAASPGDTHGLKNFEGDLRRAIAALKGEQHA